MLSTDEAVVSMDSLRRDELEVPDASVVGSDTIEPRRDMESLSPSSVAPIWRNSGY